MKSIIVLLLLMSATFHAQELDVDNTQPISLEQLHLNGKVKQITTYRQTKEIDAKPIIAAEKTFDKNGLLMLHKIYYQGRLQMTFCYTYKIGNVETLTEIEAAPYGNTTLKNFSYLEQQIKMQAYVEGVLRDGFIRKTNNNDQVLYSKHENYVSNSYCEYGYTYYENVKVKQQQGNCFKDGANHYSYRVDYTYKNDLLVKKQRSNSISKNDSSITEIYSYDNAQRCIKMERYIDTVLVNKETKVYASGVLKEHHFFNKADKETKVINFNYDPQQNLCRKSVVDKTYNTTLIYTYDIAYF
ncbi:hypothetical protein [Winogradskyella arenosi]|uniref:YD repeat-containing protein n=1 Tax=Winogradskyella arenosi TaxID=533325 RepID=A0A368ZLD5_9FLAO|nr:hypothetical protein [Winogradskyella arenosi]RCW92435.1 hypothetical protein DFQ08_102460 [Winogradskyella arenosi]